MTLTNKYSLPQPIVDAIKNDDYSPGNAYITVSSLWKPPRIRALEKQHADSLDFDAADGIFSLLGKSIHSILERADTTAIVEERLYATLNGVTISGQFDRLVYTHNTLQDYKVTSTWSVVYFDETSDWTPKLNSYRWLLHQNNIRNIDKLEIVAILRDWRKREARYDPSYPQKQVVVVPIEVWPLDVTEKRMTEQLQQHLDAEKALPLCTDDERWIGETKYAVIKDGNKKATKTFSTNSEAVAFLNTHKDAKKMRIETRVGEPIRCLDYCAVGSAGLCTQWLADPRNAKEQLKKEFI